MRKIPKVSIIIPTYNRAHLIKQTLKSVQAQTFSSWECLIIDDGSTDDTQYVLKTFLEEDERIKYFKRDLTHQKGPSGCRNQGLDLAKGEFLIFFDSDDIVHPRVLEICLDLLDSEDLEYCRFNKTPFWGDWNGHFDEVTKFKSQYLDRDVITAMVTNQLPFACCTVMWRRKAIASKRFNEDLSYAEEWEYYTRLLLSGMKGISIDRSLYYNRKHHHSNTGEFWRKDPIRLASKIKASKEMIKNISKRSLLEPTLTKYFIRLAFLLNSYSLLQVILDRSEYGWVDKFKYKAGFVFYPVLRPVFRLKGRLKSV